MGPSGDPGVRGVAFRALGAAVVGAALWVVAAGPLGVTVGLLVVAAFVGWLIGSAARSWARRGREVLAARQAGRSEPATPPTATRAIAVAAAAMCWLLALVALYVYSMAIIPALPGGAAASTDLGQRIRDTPIFEFYAQSFGPLDVIEAAVLGLTAWWSAR